MEAAGRNYAVRLTLFCRLHYAKRHYSLFIIRSYSVFFCEELRAAGHDSFAGFEAFQDLNFLRVFQDPRLDLASDRLILGTHDPNELPAGVGAQG